MKIKKMLLSAQGFYKQHRLATVLSGIVIAGALIYSNPQGFINLWLSRDQQAAIMFKNDNTAKAALTFADNNWIAYSYYKDQDFEKAANVYAKLDGVEAQFAHANALAHAGGYFQAKDLYQEIIDGDANHQGAIHNLQLMETAIKKMKKSPGEKTQSNEIQKDQKLTVKKAKEEKPQAPLSSEIWLHRVQQNPSKFLAKKFQQEYKNEQK